MQGNLYKRFYGQGSGGYTAEHQLQGRVRRSEQGTEATGSQEQYVPKHKISITKDGPTEDEIFEAQIKAHSTTAVPETTQGQPAPAPAPQPAASQPAPAPAPMQQPVQPQQAPVMQQPVQPMQQQIPQPGMIQRPGLAQGTVPRPGIGQPDIPRPGLAQPQALQQPAYVQPPMPGYVPQQPMQPQPAPAPAPQPAPMAQQPVVQQPAPTPVQQQPMQPQPAPQPAPTAVPVGDDLLGLIDEFRAKAEQLEELINRKEQRAEALRQMIANGENAMGQPGMVVSSVDTGEIVSQVNMQISALQNQMNQQLFAVSEDLKASMAQISQSVSQVTPGEGTAGIDPQQIETIVAEIESIKTNVDGLQEKIEGKIHSEGVASYRNIADLFKGLESDKEEAVKIDPAVTKELQATRKSVRIATVFAIVNFALIAILSLYSMDIITIF